MTKLLLNPALKVLPDGDVVSLMSEVESMQLPLDCLPLLTRLQEPTDIDSIPAAELAHLKLLGERRLLVNASCNGLAPEVASYWLARGFYPGFTRDQLQLSIQFVGAKAPAYRALFEARYPECTVVDEHGQLVVCITEDLLACEIPPGTAPVVPIKIGGLKQSIGPVLSPAFSYDDLCDCIARPDGADLSLAVPASVQATADGLLLSELYHLRVQAGAHMAARHVIEWNMSTLSKKFWKVKPL